MADPDDGVDIAAGIEVGLQLHPDRIRGGHQIIEDAIGHLFMGDRPVPITVHVELDRLELNNPWARLINQPQHSKIWIARERALASEFRQLNRHLIGTTGAGVFKADQLRIRNRTLAVQRGLSLLFCHAMLNRSESNPKKPEPCVTAVTHQHGIQAML